MTDNLKSPDLSIESLQKALDEFEALTVDGSIPMAISLHTMLYIRLTERQALQALDRLVDD